MEPVPSVQAEYRLVPVRAALGRRPGLRQAVFTCCQVTAIFGIPRRFPVPRLPGRMNAETTRQAGRSSATTGNYWGRLLQRPYWLMGHRGLLAAMFVLCKKIPHGPYHSSLHCIYCFVFFAHSFGVNSSAGIYTGYHYGYLKRFTAGICKRGRLPGHRFKPDERHHHRYHGEIQA